MTYRLLERLIAGAVLLILQPFFAFLYLLVRFDSQGPFLFLQLRAGLDGKPFWIYKIRTMIQESESLRSKVESLNEADGPVFKIQDDPRYTRIGKVLSRLAIDELPQLMNILEGNMAFVGPRPLPLREAADVPKKYSKRFSVLPGMTSTWIVEGAHVLSFKQWMELDCKYVKEKSIRVDIFILLKTMRVVGIFLLRFIFSVFAYRRTRTR